MDQPQTSRASKPIIRRALAYVTSGTRLLLLAYADHAEEGFRVPVGTVGPGEEPGDVALREALAETGLSDLTFGSFLGREVVDMAPFGIDELHERWCWHVVAVGRAVDTWRSDEPVAEGEPAGHRWVDLREDLPPMVAGHDRFIPELRRLLGIH